MDNVQNKFLPVVITESTSILEVDSASIDDLTKAKRDSAKEASKETEKNKIQSPTQRRYKSVHDLYESFCDELKIPSVPSTSQQASEAIHSFISCSIVNKKIKPQTVSVYLAAMKNYFYKKYSTSPTKSETLDGLKKSSKNITAHNPVSKKALDINHVLEMIERCDISTLKGLRDRAVIALAFCSACRRSEVASVHLSKFHEDVINDGYVMEIQTKTGFKSKKVKSIKGINLRKYIKEWKQAASIEDGFLFFKVDRHGNALTKGKSPHIQGQEVKNIIKHYAAGIDPNIDVSQIGGHSTRSGVATTLLKRGAAIKSVQELLGHADVKMTLHYHKINDGWEDHATNVLNEDEE